ncbi:tRNA endonuclease ANKZF1 isoform X2 [Osmerus eperlanus]|uniref:tRNA endonuclease ANKZF1 isoform X2 n=1 Tax=Osmerus eperlanus TaxID=29151 RepID=UPI002E10C970
MMSAGVEYRSIFDYCQVDGVLNGLRDVTDVKEQPSLSNSVLSSVSQVTAKASLPPFCSRGAELCPNEGSVDNDQREDSLAREGADMMACSACQCHFDCRDEQMEHYKLDWHRFNLRQRIVGLPPVTVEEFERKMGTEDMSSISGTDSDSKDSSSDWAVDDPEVIPAESDGYLAAESSSRLSKKAVFQNTQGQYLAVFRCMLQAKSNVEVDLVPALQSVSSKAVWIILMTGGGHFAGAVFQGRDVLQHKTFHRYTVRAKHGTAQGLRDAKDRSHTPKSAGAALRRYNEAALIKEIKDLLEGWAEHLTEASLIFLRAPSYNKNIFFGGRTAPLDKKDIRIRTLPFATRRATFREIKRVHEMLSTIHVYGKETDVYDILNPSKKVWRKKVAKPRPRPDPDQDHTALPAEREGNDKEGEVVELEVAEVKLSMLDLRELQPSRHRKRRRKRRMEGCRGEAEGSRAEEEEKEEESETVGVEENKDKPGRNRDGWKPNEKTQLEEEEMNESWEYGLRDALYTACKVGNVDALLCLLQLHPETGDQGEERKEAQGGERTENQELQKDGSPSESPGVRSPLTLLNRPINSSGFTLLHVASSAAQRAVVRLLMEAGGDPACRDKKGQTPYLVAPGKDTRNVFRKYMAENPDKYDYSQAQVPGPLTVELESKQTEKKKAQKAAKKQREKEQKEERRKQELEVEEKRRFAALSDREKRALAAEKRLAEQSASTGATRSNTRRCWQCGESLLDKVPFQYLDFTFCTPHCVQTHRKAKT